MQKVLVWQSSVQTYEIGGQEIDKRAQEVLQQAWAR